MSKLRDRLRAILDRTRAWLTDARRQAVHAALGTAATLAVTIGWVSDEQATVLVGFAGSALVLAQGALGLLLLRASERARWFDTTGRGLIYGFAAAGGAAGIAFNIWGDGSVTAALGVLSAGLTVLSTLTSVVNVQTVPPSDPSTLDPSTMLRSDYQDAIDG